MLSIGCDDRREDRDVAGHVQRCLRELEIAGYIRRERTPRCRVIWLLWRCERPVAGAISSPIPPVVETTVGDDARGPQDYPVTYPPRRGVAHPTSRHGPRRRDYSHGPPRRNSPAPRQRAPNVLVLNAKLVTWTLRALLSTPDHHPVIPTPTVSPAPLLDELRTIPGADAGMVRVVANRLAAWLMDIASLGYYISVLAKAAAGVIPVEAIVAAYNAATKAKGSPRRPGAIFCYTVNNYVKPPSPSEIRSPQARVGPPPPTGDNIPRLGM